MVVSSRQAFLIADLSYGDTGKGSIVDYLNSNPGGAYRRPLQRRRAGST
jgi:adenylosuccinate synthase